MMKMNRLNKFSKKVVTIIVLLNVIFAVGVLFVFWHTGSEPSVLVGSWFAFTTGELWALAGIKKKELEEGVDKDA